MSTNKLNEWTEKTLNLATNGNYLDRLLEIYPAELPPRRSLPDDIKKEIINYYQKGKYEDLVILLIDLNDNYPFPIEHPYAALLRHLNKRERHIIIRRNPKVIKTLANLLVSLGLNDIIKGVERPEDINRTLGAAFKNWVEKKFTQAPFKILGDYRRFKECANKEICIYAGPDEEIAGFIETQLKLKGPREGFFNRDIVVKVKNLYIIGEARFLSTPGGSQNRDLDNTLEFVETMENIASSSTDVKVKGIALLDGIVWFYSSYVERIKQRAKGERVVMSALLLEEYLLDLFKKLP